MSHRCRSLQRLPKRLLSSPPTHFNNPNSTPRPFGEEMTQVESLSSSPPSTIPTAASPPTPPASMGHGAGNGGSGFVREFVSLLTIGVLSYLAIDNYSTRVKLEKVNKELNSINLKRFQVEQAKFLNYNKQKDVQILQERREHSKRDFKMSLHIALLRKQLKEAGLNPIDIDQVIKQFESNVKADYSSKNITGQAMWLKDESDLKSYFPNPRDYDKKQIDPGLKD